LITQPAETVQIVGFVQQNSKAAASRKNGVSQSGLSGGAYTATLVLVTVTKLLKMTDHG